MKKTFSVAIVVIAVIIVFNAIISGNNGSSSYSSSYSSSSSSSADKAAQMTIEEYEEEAISVTYDELKRNPNEYKGKFIVMKLYVAQIVSDKQWRTYTYGNSQWSRYDIDEEFYVFDKRTSGTNVIEKDVITVYGVYRGTVEVQRAMTRTKEKIPSIDVFRLELNK